MREGGGSLRGWLRLLRARETVRLTSGVPRLRSRVRVRVRARGSGVNYRAFAPPRVLRPV